MKHIKLYEQFITESERKVFSLSDLHKMEKWIKEFMSNVDKLEDSKRNEWYSEAEKDFDQDTLTILDSQYSADKLHYNQNGRTVGSGGIDTYPFITDFDTIVRTAESIYDKVK